MRKAGCGYNFKNQRELTIKTSYFHVLSRAATIVFDIIKLKLYVFFEGVEKFMTDMTRHHVVVMGKISPAKVLKKLKKTGKRVEMILSCEYDIPDVAEQEDEHQDDFLQPAPNPLMYDYLRESTLYTIFSDENPNACSIM
ncbi:hypothetical protein E3N88_15844 [Mikania micrantha]|uniref:HMA domain-containing protein n=1 Tax=Mikania micrantha TaxID=192012 RepID=A0A5N6NWR7_9ASTR|nr:hypothetical protein E3N88_15844 [Mikania micrantha]